MGKLQGCCERSEGRVLRVRDGLRGCGADWLLGHIKFRFQAVIPLSYSAGVCQERASVDPRLALFAKAVIRMDRLEEIERS